MCFNAIRKNKILAKISEFTVVQFWSTNEKYCFNRKVHNFQIVFIVSRTSHIS